MKEINYEVVLDLFRIIVLVVINVIGIRIISMKSKTQTEKSKTISEMQPLLFSGMDDYDDNDGGGKRTICLVFFILAMLCMLFNDVYWLVYDILRPDIRMPFAANEFAEWAFFMMLGAALSYHNPIRFRYAVTETICAILFTAANVALWIGWSGEWLQDILTGPVFAYFICSVVWKVKKEEAFSNKQFGLLGITAFMIISAEAVTFFVGEAPTVFIENVCFGVLLAVTVILLARTIISFYKGEAAGKCVACAFTFFAWNVFFMYLSEEIHWLVASGFSGISFIVMFVGIVKEAGKK